MALNLYSFLFLVCEILPNAIKDSESFQAFRAKIQKRVPVNCPPCGLCKIYHLSAASRIYIPSVCKVLFTIMIYIDAIMKYGKRYL